MCNPTIATARWGVLFFVLSFLQNNAILVVATSDDDVYDSSPGRGNYSILCPSQNCRPVEQTPQLPQAASNDNESKLKFEAWRQLIGGIPRRRSLSRQIEDGDEICGDGRYGFIPNQDANQALDITDGVASDWGDLELPSVLEINRFNSEIYFRSIAFGDLGAADLNYNNGNQFFLVPLAQGGMFARRKLQRSGDRLLGIAYANWVCATETLTILVHAVAGLQLNTTSVDNLVLADGTLLRPSDPRNFIRDSDNAPVGFEIQFVVPCDSCLNFEVSALIDDAIASSGKRPQLDLALPCCVVPSVSPSSTPSREPSASPSESNVPSLLPSIAPSTSTSQAPSEIPSGNPTTDQSQEPSTTPSEIISTSPTLSPTPDFLQICAEWQAPRFYPYRVEQWSGQELRASAEDQCCPEKYMHYTYKDNQYNGDVNAQVSIAADRSYTLFINGSTIGAGRDWQHSQTFNVRLMPGDVVAVEAIDNGGISGLVAEINFVNGGQITTSSDWKASPTKTYGWNTKKYDDSSWKQALSYGRINDSQPWRSYGYTNGLSKKSLAEWIWLQRNPTRVAYFRYQIPSTISTGGYITLAADNNFDLYLNGELIGSGSKWTEATKLSVTLKRGDAIAVRCSKGSQAGGLAAEILLNSGELIFSSSAWKVSTTLESGWSEESFDDSLWSNAVEFGIVNQAQPWISFGEVKGFLDGTQTSWIWTQSGDDSTVFFRFVVPDTLPMGTEVRVAADSFYSIFLNGRLVGQGNNWQQSHVYTMSLFKDDVVGLESSSGLERSGLVAEINLLNGDQQFSSGTWKATGVMYEGWNTKGFDSYDWPAALDLGPITAYPWNNRVQGLLGTPAHWIWARAKDGEDKQVDSGVAYMRIVPHPGTFPTDGTDICDQWGYNGDDSYLRNEGNLLNTAAYTGTYSPKVQPLYDPLDDAVCFNEDYFVRKYNLNEMIALYQKFQRAFDRELSDFSEFTEEYNRVTHNRLPGMMLRMCFHDNSVHSHEPKFQDYVAANLDGESGRWNGPFKYLDTSGGDASNLICPEERHHPNNDHDQSASRVLRSLQEYLKHEGYESLSYADLLHNGCKAALVYLTGYDPVSYFQLDPFYFGRKDACHVDVKCPKRKYPLCGCSELLPGVPLSGPDYNAWFKDRGMSECLWMSLMWSHTTVDSMASMCPIRKMSCLAQENDVRAFGDKSKLYFEAGDYLDYYDFFLERGEHTTVEYSGPGKNRHKTCDWIVEGEHVPWPLTEVDCTLTLDNVIRAGLDDLASAIVNLHRPGYNAVYIFGCALNMFSGSGYLEGGICSEIGPKECKAPPKHFFGSFFS